MEDKDIYILLVAFTIAGLLVFLVLRQRKTLPISDGNVPNPVVPVPILPDVFPIPGLVPSPLPGVSPIPGLAPVPAPIPGVVPAPIPGVVPAPIPGVVPAPIPGVVPAPIPGVVPAPLLKCGSINTKSAYLINGNPVFPGKYPWVCAFLQTPAKPPPSVCTGTLISPTWILSAAHCEFPNHLPVTIGAVDVTKKEPQTQTKRIVQVVNHPNYRGIGRSCCDICLMKLDSPVTVNNYVHPICLPTVNLDLTGKPLIAAGFGSITANPIQSSSLLREGVFHEVATCKNPQLFNKSDRICLQSDVVQICVGDSGGPLMLNNNGVFMIVGVCSTGEGAKCFPPFIHTRVSSFLPWIKQYVKDA
jgi:hypothetical protein